MYFNKCKQLNLGELSQIKQKAPQEEHHISIYIILQDSSKSVN